MAPDHRTPQPRGPCRSPVTTRRIGLTIVDALPANWGLSVPVKVWHSLSEPKYKSLEEVHWSDLIRSTGARFTQKFGLTRKPSHCGKRHQARPALKKEGSRSWRRLLDGGASFRWFFLRCPEAHPDRIIRPSRSGWWCLTRPEASSISSLGRSVRKWPARWDNRSSWKIESGQAERLRRKRRQSLRPMVIQLWSSSTRTPLTLTSTRTFATTHSRIWPRCRWSPRFRLP